MIGRIAITSWPSSSWITHAPLDDRVRAEDRGLRLADHRRAVERAVAAGVRDRERAALHLVGQQLLVARALGDVGHALRDPEQVQRLGVLQHGDDQALAVGELDREAEVDVRARDDLVAADLAVHPRVLAQRLHCSARDEREVRRVDAVVLLELLLQLLADLDDLRHVDLDRARHVRARVERAAHVLGDPTTHRAHRLERLADLCLRRSRSRSRSGRAGAARERRVRQVPRERPGRPEAAGACGAACAFPPPSTNARMSFFVTRPLRPLPWTWPGSTPCSAAMRATTGETKLLPLPLASASSDGSLVVSDAAAGAGVASSTVSAVGVVAGESLAAFDSAAACAVAGSGTSPSPSTTGRPRCPRARSPRASCRPRPSRPPGRGSRRARPTRATGPRCRPCRSRSRAGSRRR